MENIIHYLILVPLLIILYQDFKQRSISWWTIPLLLIIGGIQSYFINDWQQGLRFFLVNGLFIGFQYLVLTIYFSIKERKLVQIIDRWIGLGDWLFFIGLATLFSPVHYIMFFIFSILLILVVFLILKNTILKQVKTIPLAGAMSLVYTLTWLFFFQCWDKFYSDELLYYLLQ
jgi:hypothetical protein